MSTSPSLRLSLRRKRPTISTENSGSPIIKKSSPTLPEVKEPPSTPKSYKPHRSNKNLSHPALRRSPRLAREKSSDKDDSEESNLKTPVGIKWTHSGEDGLRQPSPDMPFLSSQLCSTQECEVVWDCDSPGFTKDDLKRMHSGGEAEGPDKPVQITEFPHRQLFPLTRLKTSKAPSSSNTTAQLNDLLDLLSSKEHAERRKKEGQEDPNNHHKTLRDIIPPKGNLSEDSCSSESLAILEPMKEAYSQPFEVPCASKPKNSNQTFQSDNDDSLWEDDLSIGMCDISDTVLTEQGSNKNSSKEVEKSNLPQETAELSSASTDIFDDDLFSDSVILSTQAIEEAMIKDTKDIINDENYSYTASSKETHLKVKGGQQCQEKYGGNNNSVKNINRNCSKSEAGASKIISNNSTASNRIISSVEMKAISTNLDTSPQRKVRRSFRFGLSPKNAAKSAPSLLTEKGNQPLTSLPLNPKVFKQREARGELRKTDSLPSLKSENLSRQNLPASYLISNELSRAPASKNNPNTQMTKDPIVRKSLFKNNTKSEEVKQRSSIQATRGPLLRSQSSGDARITTSSPVGRRSNSSVELETSQDLDDDEFFKSLLSMLPEEEGGLSVDPSIKLAPIISENQSSKPQMSMMPSISMKLTTGKRAETRDSTFSKRKASSTLPQNHNCVPPQNLRDIPPQNQRSVPPQNQRNVPRQNLHNVTSQNFSSIPCQKPLNMLSQNICKGKSQNHNALSQKLHNVPSQNLHTLPSQNLYKVAPQNSSCASSQNQNACKTSSHGPTNAPPQRSVNRSTYSKSRQVNQEVAKPQMNLLGKKSATLVQGGRTTGAAYSSLKPMPPDINRAPASENGQQQTNDTFDDGLFEDDVLSLIDEVESQYGSQNAPSEPSPSPQSSQTQQVKCTQEEIAQKKAAALRRREERRRQQRR